MSIWTKLRHEDSTWLALAAALALSFIVSAGSYNAFGGGTNAVFIPSLVLLLPLCIKPRQWKEVLFSLGSFHRLVLVLAILLIITAQIAHPESWRLQRDSLAFLLIAAIGLSLHSLSEVMKALRAYGVFFVIGFFALMPFEQFAIFEGDRFGSVFHPNSTAIQALLIICAYLWTGDLSKLTRALMIAGLLGVLLVCGSRTASFAALAVIADRLLWNKIKSVAVRTGVAVAGLTSAIVLFFTLLPYQAEYWILRGANLTSLLKLGGRSSIWLEYLSLAAVDPVFGLGDDGYIAAVPLADGTLFQTFHAHNSLLFLAVIYGLPLMLCMSLLAYAGFKSALRQLRAPNLSAQDRDALRAAVTILVAGAGAGMLEPMLASPANGGGAIYWLLIFMLRPTLYTARLKYSNYQINIAHYFLYQPR